ncbi:MAG TPA: hypothetical protein P5279_01780 [Anaerohalosphaeraceae bacterium]|jgi:hypothetical protein|nr:hypothetical protein [Anaerohalosphaeraceae bacterium]HRT49199.1 hypothetical protein [Anaerohalosphaeraceae bacterium]HRT85262.1 hypothetical protein [Anaerohalosphaeraceae bacterium]
MTPNTTIYQFTISIAVLLAVMTLIVPRRFVLAPFVIAACFVPTDQRVIIMELDFTVLRMLVVVGVLRVFLYGEYRPLRYTAIDYLLLAWAVVGSVVFIAREGDTEAVINRAGYAFNAVGLYWLFRQNLVTWDSLKHVFALFAVAALVSLPLVLIESTTGANPFVYLGKVITAVREEKLRCQGAFPHSIMMGLYWAVLTPVFLALARVEKHKLLYPAACVASIVIIAATASSTPILVFLMTVAVFGVFAWRQYTSVAVWASVGALTALHIVMNAPVWHLLARVNVIGGSTGWHRYNLIDKAIRHFGEWMLMGCSRTDHWGFGLEDVTNQYVLEGVRGGAVTLLLFVALMYVVMKTLLRSSLAHSDRRSRFLAWSLFAMMFAHGVGFIGASYFGQITVLWYLTLAAAAMLAEPHRIRNRNAVRPVFLNGGSIHANHAPARCAMRTAGSTS